jgi:hypothetical protein
VIIVAQGFTCIGSGWTPTKFRCVFIVLVVQLLLFASLNGTAKVKMKLGDPCAHEEEKAPDYRRPSRA